MRILLFFTFLLTLHALPANANDNLFVLEIFTYPNCAPGDLEKYYNPDGTLKEPAESDKKFNKQHIASVFEEITKEHPNAITLHYFNDLGYHLHDENGADIPGSDTIDEDLAEFINNKGYIHYRNQSFLETSLNAQMAINGTHATAGTMKHVAEAAIKNSLIDHVIHPAKLAINGQNLNLELPNININNEIDLYLIGYQKHKEIKENQAVPAINPINLVTSYKMLPSWNGDASSQTIPISDMKGDSFALIAQNSMTGKIYAAGKIETSTD